MNNVILIGIAEISDAFGKGHGGMPVAPSSYPTGELGSSVLSPVESQLFSTNRGDETSAMLSSGKVLEHDGSSNTLSDANRVVQVYIFQLST